MSKQITSVEVEAVQRMLAAGMRQTEIARELDLSVWMVAKIADATRRDEEFVKEGETLDDDAPPGFEARNLRRCPSCGAMVYLWPCLACRLGTSVLPLELEVEEEEADEEEGFLFIGEVA